MTLKPCPCCKKIQTTKNAEFVSRWSEGREMLMFNCKSCHSTFVIVNQIAMIKDIIDRLGPIGPTRIGTPRKAA